ncbi:tyrosine recombinase xerd [Plakobranchus ocellatus]|uniref:Tyrosine recombinase xerd n=1 Tax=Plakobranchus ocellatus TaxID=259542 RepID=A0AAV3YRV1_9GAST|nr:tyrosine recombinase xerd [Plakobranchus ocellatus]
MTVTLSGEKREHVETLINKVLLTPMITVRTLAQTVGTLIACFLAIEYGQLYHRHLEILKINSLKTVYDFERLILLSEEAMSDLKWWLHDGLKSKKSLVREKPRATIKSDSSGYAWGAGIEEAGGGSNGESLNYSSNVNDTILVPRVGNYAEKPNNTLKAIKNTSVSSIRHKSNSSSLQETEVDGLHLVREKTKSIGMSRTTSKIILSSWREKTQRQYSIYLKRYDRFCKTKNADPFDRNEKTLIAFLTDMYKKKYGYSAINTARAAMSSVNDVGSHPLVCRFMRGMFNLRPSCPRYTYIWDVSLVLKYLRTLAPSTGLELQSLSAKLATLCALVTGPWCQTFHAMDIKHMQISEGKATFHIASLLKTNSSKNPISTITLRAYREDRRICVFTCLKLYLKRTKHLRSTT